MKKYLFACVVSITSLVVFGQELELNESTKFYEYTHVKKSIDKDLKAKFESRLRDLNYKEITVQDNLVTGQGFTNHLVGGFATVEIRYSTKISFKDGRYKLTFTNFVLTDKNGSNPLEGMGAFKKKWIKNINKKLPEMVENIENINQPQEDW